MANLTSQHHFSDEKIAVRPSSPDSTEIGEELGSSTTGKTSVHTSRQHDETLPAYAQASGSTTSPSDEKQAISYSGHKRVPDTIDDKQLSLTSDDKQVLNQHEEKHVLTREDAKFLVSESPPHKLGTIQTNTPSSVVRSQTEASWSQRATGSYQENAFCHASALRLNHNIVVDPNDEATHFIEVSGFAKGREDVVIRQVPPHLASKGATLSADEGKSCPTISFAQFPHGRDNFVQVGLGDHTRMSEVQWLDLTRDNDNLD